MDKLLILYTNKLCDAFRYRKLLLVVTDQLAKLGFQFTPYFLTLETTLQIPDIKLPDELQMSAWGVSTVEDIEEIRNHPETHWFDRFESSLQDDDCICFTLKQNEEIMAFMWCNFDRCPLIQDMKLKADEAYLFGVFTYAKYRGKNLAPYLNSQVYQALSEMGRTRLFSLTGCFNTPALNFKKKLHARCVKAGLFIKLFHKIKWDICLKEYPV
ncbi:MAG: hypothetical protein CVU51_02680 [Deltaproteobacteria bacterium HGW-Deltaproteobacteria-1]|jgi:hypothetical protein|nr:MAG: hypothetical protein CVU51_02680 [Deltaproteobacteria bacterium HGW-Deltaproteobacteria-1]